MKVFISWSGDKSKAVATALRDWLPDVMHALEPFMSQIDIDAGSRPMTEIEGELEGAKFGIICVSSDNWQAPWLNFEAGAISKKFGLTETRVAPLLIDLKPQDIDSPLKQFQMKTMDKVGIYEVVKSINILLEGEALDPQRLAKAFERWWPDLQEKLEEARAITPAMDIGRSSDAKLDELLNMVRSMANQMATSRWRLDEPDVTDATERLLAARRHFGVVTGRPRAEVLQDQEKFVRDGIRELLGSQEIAVPPMRSFADGTLVIRLEERLPLTLTTQIEALAQMHSVNLVWQKAWSD